KGGEIMENLAKIDVIIFDKTGTLTQGEPTVSRVKAFDMEESALLKVTAEAEMISEHHLGQAIVQEAKKRDIQLTNKTNNYEGIKGDGLYAYIDGEKVVVGNRKLLN